MEDASRSNITLFDPEDTSTVSARWKKWKRGFQIFLDWQNVTIPARKRSYLLHHVGPKVQDVFFSLQGEAAPVVLAGSDEYKEAVKLLDDYFLPMKCLPLERHKFRNLVQVEDESIEHFVLRLREQGNLCEYGDHLDEEIKEQLFEKGASDDLRAKILNKPEMTLLETIGKHRQSAKMSPCLEEVNKITQTTSASKNNPKRECYRCGRSGHYANDENCPALNRKCEWCGYVGHFKKRCNTKRKTNMGDKWQRRARVNQKVEDSDDSDEDSDDSDSDRVKYLFATEPDCTEKFVCAVGGVKITWVVDSGAGVNVINRQTWEHLKQQKVRVNYQTTDVNKSLKDYGGHRIKVVGMFSTDVATTKKVAEAEMYVVENGSCCLLGRNTAKTLGILNINTAVWSNEEDEIRIAKIVRAEEKPKQQTQCSFPIPLRKRTEQEMQRQHKQDIFEEASRDPSLISRIVVQLRPVSEGDVANAGNLRLEDQRQIRDSITSLGGGVVKAALAGKGEGWIAERLKVLNDFGVKCTSSGIAIRRRCENAMLRNEVRIENVDFTAETIEQLRSAVGAVEVPVRRLKAETEEGTIDEELRAQQQSQLMKIPHCNRQAISGCEEACLPRVCDILTFGSSSGCKYVLQKSAYVCEGSLADQEKWRRRPNRGTFVQASARRAERQKPANGQLQQLINRSLKYDDYFTDLNADG